MVYYAREMELEVISELFRGTVNDAVIARDLRSAAGTLYTLLVVHDRSCARTLLQIMQESDRTGESPCLLQLAQNEDLVFVFPYREERKFSAFAKGQLVGKTDSETIAIHLVMECLSTGLPWPLLYLVLQQDAVQIAQDNTVYFTMGLDLSDLDPEKDERSCVSYCNELLLDLLTAPLAGSRKKPKKLLKSYELIQKKNANHAYSGFTELYHDIKVTALPIQKLPLRARLMGMWKRNRDRLFRVLLVLCVLVTAVALAALVTQAFFGEIPWLRLFQHTFDVIGTENLHQGGRL